MGSLCFKQEMPCESLPIEQPNDLPKESPPVAKAPTTSAKPARKAKKKRPPVVTVSATSKAPQRAAAKEIAAPNITNATAEYKDIKRKAMQLFSKSTSIKKPKASNKKTRKNNFLKVIEEYSKDEKLTMAERKSSPTTTSDCSEMQELGLESHREEDFLGEMATEAVENSDSAMQDKNELRRGNTQGKAEHKEGGQKESSKMPLPFMRKLHCEIAYAARTATSHSEALLPLCAKLKDNVDSALRSLSPGKSAATVDVRAAIYGSVATKLACEHSDLDLAVRGLRIPCRSQLHRYMLLLSEKLKSNPLVVSCVSIPTARVPLISAVPLDTTTRCLTWDWWTKSLRAGR